MLSRCLTLSALVLASFEYARVHAVEFATDSVAGKRITICRVNVKEEPLALFLRDEAGRPLKSFAGVETWLATRGKKLVFAMNAGMYHGDLSPVGLFVNEGRELAPLNLANAEGNFFLKPNGVFVVTADGAQVIESSQYPRLKRPAILATQSGPLLVLNGRIHPSFRRESTSRLFRNGVGVPSPDTAVFAITEEPVNFYEFATLFRDVLGCPTALFFDGTISSLHSAALGRSDQKIDLGPIIGIAK
jgi:uncharacterized protein YigE (DUF2233 family)